MKTIIKNIAICLLALGFASCEDYIDVMPKGKQIPEKVEDFAAMLNYEYGVHYSPIAQCLYLLNDYQVNKSDLNSDNLRTANFMWDETADRVSLNNSDESTYYQTYAAISTCNLVIEHVPTASDGTEERKREVVACAKVIRAQCYYILVNFYADQYDAATCGSTPGVPVIFSADVNAPYEQMSVGGVYETILNDVREALDNGLPEHSENILWPDRATAYAFLCRVCMSMGRYAEALANAELALERNSALFDWNAYYDSYAEAIEDLENYTTFPSPFGFSYVENYNFRAGERNTNRAMADISIPQERGERFEEGDAKFMCRWKLKTNGENTFYQGISSGFMNYQGLTTVEVYLDKAECLAREGRLQEAMEVLDKVRQTRIRPDKFKTSEASNAAEAIEKIRLTKDNELICSIVPFADAKRFNREGLYGRTMTKTFEGKTYTLSPDSHLWTMVFPAGAVKNNGNGTLTQNSK